MHEPETETIQTKYLIACAPGHKCQVLWKLFTISQIHKRLHHHLCGAINTVPHVNIGQNENFFITQAPMR